MTIHKYFRELVRDLFEVEIPDLTITNIKLLINELDKEDKKPSGGKRNNSGESGQFCLAEIFLLQSEFLNVKISSNICLNFIIVIQMHSQQLYNFLFTAQLGKVRRRRRREVTFTRETTLGSSIPTMLVALLCLRFSNELKTA